MPVCKQCKARDNFDFDEKSGTMVCLECGTQVAGYVEEVMDRNECGTFGYSQKRAAAPRAERAARKEKEWPDPAQVFEAFQHVLQTFLSAVMTSHSESCSELPSVVGGLWFRCVRLFPEATSEAQDVRAVPKIAGSAKDNPISLGPALAATLCYLGCLQLGWPVLVNDIIEWCNSLELLSAHATLPSRLHLVGRRLPDVVRLPQLPSFVRLRPRILVLLKLLELSPPPPSPQAWLERLSSALELPPTLQAMSAAICSYTNATAPSSGPALRRPSTGLPRAEERSMPEPSELAAWHSAQEAWVASYRVRPPPEHERARWWKEQRKRFAFLPARPRKVPDASVPHTSVPDAAVIWEQCEKDPRCTRGLWHGGCCRVASVPGNGTRRSACTGDEAQPSGGKGSHKQTNDIVSRQRRTMLEVPDACRARRASVPYLSCPRGACICM